MDAETLVKAAQEWWERRHLPVPASGIVTALVHRVPPMKGVVIEGALPDARHHFYLDFLAMDPARHYLLSVVYQENVTEPPLYAHAVLPRRPRAHRRGATRWNPVVCRGPRPALEKKPSSQTLRRAALRAANDLDPAILRAHLERRHPLVLQIITLDPPVVYVHTDAADDVPPDALLQELVREHQHDPTAILMAAYMFYSQKPDGGLFAWSMSSMNFLRTPLTPEEKAERNAAALVAELDAEEAAAAAAAVTQTPTTSTSQSPAPAETETETAAAPPGAPPEFVCPLTRRLFGNPVLAADGYSYERAALQALVDATADTGRDLVSPTTGKPMQPIAVPNHLLRNLVQQWRAEMEG